LPNFDVLLLFAILSTLDRYLATSAGDGRVESVVETFGAMMSASQSSELALLSFAFLLLLSISAMILFSSFTSQVNAAQMLDRLFPVPVGDSKQPTDDDSMHS
jgi:hypothetical protein